MTQRGASTLGGMGHTSRKQAVFLLKVLPPPGLSACCLLVRSCPRKAPRSLAALSILMVVLASHEVHIRRVLPVLVLPPLFILVSHGGHA